jgi:hypothetical protein
MKRETKDFPVMSRRHFGALTGGAAMASLLLTHPSRSSAQTLTVASKVGSGVAANPQDRVVFPVGLWEGVKFMAVITESGDIYAQQLLSQGRVGPALRVGAIQRLDSNVRWVLPNFINGGIYVVRTAGDVVHHPMTVSIGVPESLRFGPATPVRIPGPVGVSREDRRALIVADRLVVFRSDGATGFHRIASLTEWGAGEGMPAESYRPVASNPQDKWLIQLGGGMIGVITSSGELFVHEFDRVRNVILPPKRANTPQRIAANPQDRFAFSNGNSSVYVVTTGGDLYEHRVTYW